MLVIWFSLYGIVCFGDDGMSSPCWHCHLALRLGKVGGRWIQIVHFSWIEQRHGHALDECVLDYGTCSTPLWIDRVKLPVDWYCNIVFILIGKYGSFVADLVETSIRICIVIRENSPDIVQCCVGRVWTWKLWEDPRWKAEIKMGKLSDGRQNTWRTRGTLEVRRGLIDGWPTYDGSVKGWWRKGNVHKTLIQWIARLFELEREATAFFFFLLEHLEPCRRSYSASLIWFVHISIEWKWIPSNNHVVSCCPIWFI